MSDPIRQHIEQALAGAPPLQALVARDERRVREALSAIAAARGVPLTVWDCARGQGPDAQAADRDAARAIARLGAEPASGWLLFLDLQHQLDRPEVVRALRNAQLLLEQQPGRHLLILAPALEVPRELADQLPVAQLPATAPAELAQRATERYLEAGGGPDVAPAATLAQAVRGMALAQVERVARRAAALGRDLLAEVRDSWPAPRLAGGALERVTARVPLAQLGGLGQLKRWIESRAGQFLEPEGRDMPRGMLLMGISGCGKSLSAKAVAEVWGLPLYRLEMSRVFGDRRLSPAGRFLDALGALDEVAPIVLWVDEIESALGLTVSGGGYDQALIYATLLTWMEERRRPVFVVATANRIQDLPAEILRRGRFDEIFFCDLPTASERREILTLHLRDQGCDPEAVGLERLMASTDGWSGAELRQLVLSARVAADAEGRSLAAADLASLAARMVPLSQTMVEQVRALRRWAHNRATPASTS